LIFCWSQSVLAEWSPLPTPPQKMSFDPHLIIQQVNF
jgi:hypothetical protein